MRSRVMPKEKLLAAADLVTFFAKYVATVAEREGPVLPNDCPQCVARAREFVNAHLNETIKMRAVADHVHLCPQHFCKKFRNATGITFTEYVSRLRVDKAKKLLLDNGNRVSEVAFECGFGSIPQFYRAFHRHTRVSPSAYRASFRQTLVGEKTKRKS
jgi:transcriptional regulator GlxA family with amidase domain